MAQSMGYQGLWLWGGMLEFFLKICKQISGLCTVFMLPILIKFMPSGNIQLKWHFSCSWSHQDGVACWKIPKVLLSCMQWGHSSHLCIYQWLTLPWADFILGLLGCFSCSEPSPKNVSDMPFHGMWSLYVSICFPPPLLNLLPTPSASSQLPFHFHPIAQVLFCSLMLPPNHPEHIACQWCLLHGPTTAHQLMKWSPFKIALHLFHLCNLSLKIYWDLS